jgi:hypothetical protein
MIASHWLAHPRTPGHGWPGRAHRSRCATPGMAAVRHRKYALASHWLAHPRTPGNGWPGRAFRSRCAPPGMAAVHRSKYMIASHWLAHPRTPGNGWPGRLSGADARRQGWPQQSSKHLIASLARASVLGGLSPQRAAPPSSALPGTFSHEGRREIRIQAHATLIPGRGSPPRSRQARKTTWKAHDPDNQPQSTRFLPATSQVACNQRLISLPMPQSAA